MKRSEFKPGDFYVLENYQGHTYVVRREKTNNEKYINERNKTYSSGIFSETYSVPFRYATEKEKQWLSGCIEANKFIPLEEIKEPEPTVNDNYSIY